nr:hypothetical protein [Tanacetum cinerariifolium]
MKLEKQHVSLVRSGKGKGHMRSVELAKSINIEEQRLQQHDIMTQLTIDRKTKKDAEDTYAEWGQKLKGRYGISTLELHKKPQRFKDQYAVSGRVPSYCLQRHLISKPKVPSEPTVSTRQTKDGDFDFVISYDKFDDEDYTFTYDKNSFSHKLVSVIDLKSNLNNYDNEIDVKIPLVDVSTNSLDDDIDNNVITPDQAMRATGIPSSSPKGTTCGPHETQYCMENPKQAFVKYASSRTDEAGEEPEPTFDDEHKDLHLNLPVLEVLAYASIYNVILEKYIKSLELGKNGSAFVQGETPTKIGDPELFTLPCRLRDSEPFDTLADLGLCLNIIPLYLFKKLNIGLLEETDHIFGLADGTISNLVGIVKDVVVHIGKLKLLNYFYILDMKKDLQIPLLIGRGFLAIANAVLDYRMAKIAIGEGITRSIFSVKGIDLGEEEAPHWNTLRKRESYKPRPSTDGIGVKPPYYARKDFINYHLPGEWEISRDVELNPFKDTLVFRRMVELLGAIPINLKCNMWESEDLIEKPID